MNLEVFKISAEYLSLQGSKQKVFRVDRRRHQHWPKTSLPQAGQLPGNDKKSPSSLAMSIHHADYRLGTLK